MEMVVFKISARSSLYIQEQCVSIPDANVEYLETKPFKDCSKPGLIALSEKPSSKICSVQCQSMIINDSQALSTIIVGCYRCFFFQL